MDKVIQPVSKLSGTIEVPGDKSITHRALIFGSLCEGDVHITNLSTAADCMATASCLEKLGINIDRISENKTIIKGRGLHGYNEPSDTLDAQNSGTTMRLLTGLLAGQPFYSVITGDDSLRRRPMKRVITPLKQMGAQISALENDSLPPITINGGNLTPIDYMMPIASAQVKSAILIAGLFCDDVTKVVEKLPSRDHTERMLKYFGGNLESDGNEIRIKKSALTPRNIIVPGDISSAIFFIIAGTLIPDSHIILKNVGLNKTRTGALDALIEMGADIKISEDGERNEEPYGDIEVRTSGLKAIYIDKEMIPSLVDEIPILALAATQAEGTTVITGAEELRFKESDRLNGIATQLKRMGAAVKENPDGLEIRGGASLTGTTVDSLGDHRLAMTLTIAGLLADGETTIHDAESVSVSFPEFFNLMDRLKT